MEFLKSTKEDLKKMTKGDQVHGIEDPEKAQNNFLRLSSVKDLIKEAIKNFTDELQVQP